MENDQLHYIGFILALLMLSMMFFMFFLSLFPYYIIHFTIYFALSVIDNKLGYHA